MRRAVSRAVSLAAVLASGACLDRTAGGRFADVLSPGAVRPDEPPVMVNAEPPFRYPATLWAQRVQGNVLLRVYVDTAGRPVADSTAVLESSGIAALDSAALAGARDLRFRPATLRRAPVGTVLNIPVFFRHPDAPPMPGDSILMRVKRAPFPP